MSAVLPGFGVGERRGGENYGIMRLLFFFRFSLFAFAGGGFLLDESSIRWSN